MPKVTIKTVFLTVAIGGSIGSTAFAQTTKITEPVNVPTRVVDAGFVAADVNQDGSLDRDEFVNFAVIKSDAGDEKYRNIVSSGEFDKKFAVHDHDADGKITVDEMGLLKDKSELMLDKPAPNLDKTEPQGDEISDKQ